VLRWFVAIVVRPGLLVLRCVELVARVEVRLDLLARVFLFAYQTAVRHRPVEAGVGHELAAIERDMPEFHPARPGCETDGLHQQVARRLPVPGTELVKRPVPRLLIAGQEPELDVLDPGPLHLP
jgi:hypothetical protein